MRAKKRHGPAASLRQQEIARLRRKAVLFRRFFDKHLKNALEAALGRVTLTVTVTTHKRGRHRRPVIRNWPPTPA